MLGNLGKVMSYRDSARVSGQLAQCGTLPNKVYCPRNPSGIPPESPSILSPESPGIPSAILTLPICVLLFAQSTTAALDDSGTGQAPVTLEANDVVPFMLVQQGQLGWPYARGEANRILQKPGVSQEWARPNEAPGVSVMSCRFPDDKQAAEAVRFYASSMADRFVQGGLSEDLRFGQDCWRSTGPTRTVLFHRGPFCFVVSAFRLKPEEREKAIADFAGALDRKAIAILEGKEAPKTKPGAAESGLIGIRSDLIKAIDNNDITFLKTFTRIGSLDDAKLAIYFLAQSAPGCEALPELLEQLRTPLDRVAIEALRKAGTSESTQALRKIAQNTKSPSIFADCMEALLKSMPEHEARWFALQESQKLAENPDADPQKLRFYMQGLGRPSDPPEVKVLRQILTASRDERLRTAATAQLAGWIMKDGDSRREVLRTITELINVPDRPARQMILLALGESGDLRNLAKICPALDDPDQAIRDAAARAVGILLDWKPIARTTPEAQDQFVTEAKKRAQPILEKLKALEDSIKQNTPE